MLFTEGGNKYLYYLQFERDTPVTEQTLETVQKRVKQLSQFWVNREIENLVFQDVLDFRKELHNRNCSLNYIRAYYILFRALFKYFSTFTTCLDYKLIKPPNVEIKDVDYLTKEEVWKMLSFFDEDSISDLRSKAMIMVLLDTGMRIHECVNLNRDTINFETKTAVIVGKGRKTRMVLFTDWSLEIIKQYLARRTDENNALFVTHTAFPFIPQRIKQDGFRNYLRAINKKMGKKITPHTLRRTAGTNLRNNGADILMIKEFLGHENLATTNRYLGIDYERLKKEHAKFMVY
jgi:site-specific recombinase XerD